MLVGDGPENVLDRAELYCAQIVPLTTSRAI
jgi:hypothetical protein